jgi:hypothetical protein
MAYAELYLGLATIIRRFDVEVHDTTEDNVKLISDYAVPHADSSSWNVKALVVGIVKD